MGFVSMLAFSVALPLILQPDVGKQAVLVVSILLFVLAVPVHNNLWTLLDRLDGQCEADLQEPKIDLEGSTFINAKSLEETCQICLEELAEGEEVANLPCGHIFHRSCVERWFQVRNTCPMRCESAQAAPPL